MAPRTPEQVELAKHFYKHRKSAACLNTVNCFFLVFGLVLAGLGLYAQFKYSWGSQLVGFPLPWAIVAIGLFLVALNCCGYVGTSKMRRTCLVVYFTGLVFVISAELVTAYLSIKYQKNLQEQIYQGWLDAAPSTKNTLQTKFKCCGYFTNNDNPGPNCVGKTGQRPCSVAIVSWIREKLKFVAITAIVAAILQLFCLVTAVVLTKKIDTIKRARDDLDYSYYYSEDGLELEPNRT
eukprot:c14142_g1_i1.p2 GENE.c14142_g1_i1~~c14142_g1_i1.p2  ORF type:complete len:236 (+),score=62.25 c14142_g1_i1:62-769(+)